MKDQAEIHKKLIQGLTPRQRKAVETIDKDLEIIACAGAGKTKTITHRILNLIAHGVKPENIVAITFTRKAAAEMKGRIYKLGQELLGDTTGFAGMYIGTIDAFCLKMLQDHKDEYAKFSVLDEVQAKIFIERYERESGFKDSAIDKAYNLNHLFDPDTRQYSIFEKYEKKISIYSGLMSILNGCWFDRQYRQRWSKELRDMLDAYNSCLREHKYFEFSGLIREMIEYLDPDSDSNGGEMSEFGRIVFDKVKYLTIDEYQDTNPSQEYLVKLFKKYAGAQLCVVGDADQTIYQFRGSDERNILDFKNAYGSELIKLKEDFRSTPAVIDIAASSIINGHIGEGDYERMIPGKINGSSLEYEEGDTVWEAFDDFDSEAEFITDRIKELRATGIPYKEMAILFRKRKEYYFGIEAEDFQKKMAMKLHEADIPYIIEGLNLLYITKEYAASRGIFDYLYEKTARPYKKSDDEFEYGYVTRSDKKEKEESEQKKLYDLWLEAYPDIEERGLKAAIRKLASLDLSKKKFGHECNMQQIYQDFIGELSILGDTGDKAERILYNLGKFSKLIADYELLYFKESPLYKINRFRRHLNKVAEGLYPEGMEDNAYLQSDAVRIMTIHQSKGLEFTAVFVPALAQNVFPGTPFDSRGKIYGPIDLIGADNWVPNYEVYKGGLEDERKMFYVAVTRAKKYLFLTYGSNYGRVNEVRSVLLTEAIGSSYLKQYDAGDEYTALHLPEIEEVPIPITLNFSLLSNYFDCPYRFKLSNLYGFVQPYTSAQGYGRVLHEIMMHIHRAWINGERPDRAQIEKIAEDALYLPFASQPQIDNSLTGAKACARAYVEQNEKDADKIVASEMDINIEMGEGVSVNGRIDLVRKIDDRDGAEKTAIVDLKSAGKDAEQCLNAEQLKIYAIGYQEMTGEAADYLMIYNLDKPDGSGNKGDSVKESELVETRRRVLDAARCIRSSELPKTKSDKCSSCYVRGLCKG